MGREEDIASDVGFLSLKDQPEEYDTLAEAWANIIVREVDTAFEFHP